MLNKQYKLYEDIKDCLQDLITVLKEDQTKIDPDVDLYFTSYVLDKISVINKLYAEKIKKQ